MHFRFERKINPGIRLVSMLFDHIIMCVVAMLFYLPIFIKLFSDAVTKSYHPGANPFSGPLMYVAVAGFSLYFCKDSINGRSIAKRVIGLQVVNNNTGEAASPLRCLARNLFCVFWPVEVIIALSNPERRLGDRVAGTKTTFFTKESGTGQVNALQVIAAVLISFGLNAGLVYLMLLH